MPEATCSECGGNTIWAWYQQPERQTIAVEIDEDGVVAYDYTGCTESSYDAGPDEEFLCGGCGRLTETIEEMVGLPRPENELVKIEAGISGDDQESSFMNATLQSAGPDVEFSIAMHADTELNTEDAVAEHLRLLFTDITRFHPSVSFEAQVGPKGDGETESGDDDGDE